MHSVEQTQRKKVESIHKLRVRWNHLFRGVLGILVGITFMYAPDTQASDTDKTEQKNKIILASENETSQPNDDFLVVRPGNSPQETVESSTEPPDESIETTAQQSIREMSPLTFRELSESAVHTQIFEEIIGSRSASFILLDANTGEILAGVNTTELMPVASAIKGPILMYFLDVVNPEIWTSVPAEYWGSRNSSQIPTEYQSAWEEHGPILHDLWRMIVLSDNESTGNALAYAHRYTNNAGDNAITAFNNWAEGTVQIDPQSGLRQWNLGGTAGPEHIDQRFEDRMVTLTRTPTFYNNVSTAADMAKYYVWLQEQEALNPQLHSTASVIMSTIPDGMYPGFLEDLALRLESAPISKDGFVGPGADNNSNDSRLATDAGMFRVIMPDTKKRDIILVTMAVNAGDLMDPIYRQTEQIIREERGDVFWPQDIDSISWLRSEQSPLGLNNFDAEKLRFILRFVNESEPQLIQDTVYQGDVHLFNEAVTLWDHAFPDGNTANRTTEAANRIMNAIYANSGEFLQTISQETLGAATSNSE